LVKVGVLLLLLLTLVVGVAGVARLNSFSKRVGGKSLLTSEIREKAGDSDRFNLLVLGYGGKGHDGQNLTDSILLYSISLDGGPASQISVPRDLWIESPVGSGAYRKVNSAYATALATGSSPRRAAGVAAKSIGAALGVPVHGWLTVDFDGFRDLVDALGGVEVDVQRSFTARYPRNDDPSVDYRWTTVKFQKGKQKMDGETAIRYARARYSANPVEGSDFGRAARQQRLVAAIKARLLSPAGVVRGFAVAGAVEDDVRTNMSVGDLARIFRRRVDPDRNVVLSENNVLVASTSSDGQYILLPQGQDWDALRRFVRSSLEGASTAQR
jgi:LCP family protein required for cell wall assembly